MVSVAAIATEAVVGTPTIRTVEEATRRLGSIGFRVEWTALNEGPGRMWLVEVRDDSGAVMDSGVGDDREDALLGVAERLLPPDR